MHLTLTFSALVQPRGKVGKSTTRMSGLASLYPPPPPFYKRYTSENCEKLREFHLEHGQETPEDEILASLLPPPPPVNQATYRNFGSIWSVKEQLPNLSESGITQLFPEGTEKSTPQLISELRKLLHSVMVGYLGLVQTLAADPTQFGPSVERLQTLFINMHHLLNTYRPLQSQESLVLKMEDQITETKKSASEMRQSNDAIRRRLEILEQRLPKQKIEPIIDNNGPAIWRGLDLDADIVLGGDEAAVE